MAGHPREERERLPGGEVAGEAVVLREEPHGAPRLGLADAGAEQGGRALARVDDPEQQLDERGLARAVRAEQPKELARLDLQVQRA